MKKEKEEEHTSRVKWLQHPIESIQMGNSRRRIMKEAIKKIEATNISRDDKSYEKGDKNKRRKIEE